MKNVLFILDYYLPTASANGICVSKVVQEFLDHGVDVSILCFQDEVRKNGQPGNAKHRHERIYEIASPQSREQLKRIKYYLKWLASKKHLPSENAEVVDMMFNLAAKIVIDNNIDTVICTHLPIESITVGKKLKEKYPFLNLVAYMLDSLSGGFLPRLLPNSFCRQKKIAWENKMLVHFDQIVLMESSRKHHETYTPNATWYKKAHFLDVPSLYNNNGLKLEKTADEEIVIAFVGTMGAGVRTPYAFLKVLSCITDLKIRFVIAGKNTCENLFEFLKPQSNITLDIMGEIPYTEAQQILYASDFLVNLGNVNLNLVPSKIFEYMSYGRPIISTYVSDADSSLPYLDKYPAVFLIDERREDFFEISERLEKFIRENINIKVPYENLKQCLYNNTAAALYALLSSTCREKI